MGTPAIQLKEISISRGSKRIIQDLSLEIASSEIVAILGPSGRGKTTLLHAIAGLTKPDAGVVELAHGQSGLVFQEGLLLPWLTVRQNIALAYQFKANYLKADSTLVSKHIDEVIAATGLSGLEGQLPDQLSGGQAQRTAIARALVLNSEILLLDEPFSSVDAITRGALQDLLRETRATLGTTIVLVTHDINEALAVADRLVVLAENDKILELRPDKQTEDQQAAQILLALGGNYVI